MPFLWDETGVVVGPLPDLRGLSVGAQVGAQSRAGVSVPAVEETSDRTEGRMRDVDPDGGAVWGLALIVASLAVVAGGLLVWLR